MDEFFKLIPPGLMALIPDAFKGDVHQPIIGIAKSGNEWIAMTINIEGKIVPMKKCQYLYWAKNH